MIRASALARNVAFDKLQEKSGAALPSPLLDALLERRSNG